VVTDLAEDAQGGIEDPLLRSLPAGADVRVVRERSAARDGARLPVR
jgi:hypothetical protein